MASCAAWALGELSQNNLFTSWGSAKVKDCWKGHDPELKTWILKSTVKEINIHL